MCYRAGNTFCEISNDWVQVLFASMLLNCVTLVIILLHKDFIYLSSVFWSPCFVFPLFLSYERWHRGDTNIYLMPKNFHQPWIVGWKTNLSFPVFIVDVTIAFTEKKTWGVQNAVCVLVLDWLTWSGQIFICFTQMWALRFMGYF